MMIMRNILSPIQIPALLFVVLTFVALTPMCSGETGFSAKLTTINNSVFPEQTAYYSITIINELNHSQRFVMTLFTTQPGWFYQENYVLEIGPGANKSTKITAKPPKDAVAGNRGFIIKIYPENDNENVLEFTSSVTVMRKKRVILKDPITDGTIYKPGDSINYNVTLRNVGSRDLRNYKLVVTFNSLSETKDIPILDSGESIRAKFKFKIGNLIPGSYKIDAQAVGFNDVVEDEIKTSIGIAEVKKIVVERENNTYILWQDYAIKLTNKGNVFTTEEVSSKLPSHLSYIMTAQNEPTRVNRIGKNVEYVWSVPLAPGEVRYIKYRVNYWIVLALTLLVLIVLGFAYTVLRSTYIVKRSVRKGKYHIIHIHIKNTTGTRMNHVKVMDHVPGIAKLVKKFDATEPKKIKKGEEGMDMEWHLGNMAPNEERIIHYKIMPLIKVMGTVKLPGAEIVYVVGKKRTRKKKSNVVHADFS